MGGRTKNAVQKIERTRMQDRHTHVADPWRHTKSRMQNMFTKQHTAEFCSVWVRLNDDGGESCVVKRWGNWGAKMETLDLDSKPNGGI
jgi:hypothetical protein